jgi:hypothetical protein
MFFLLFLMFCLFSLLPTMAGTKMAPNPKSGVPWLRKAARMKHDPAQRLLDSMNLLHLK